MSRRLGIVSGVLLSATVTAGPSHAQAEAAMAAGKEAAKAIAALVIAKAYEQDCEGRSPAGMDAMICGAMGSFSGASAEEWKRSVTTHLEEMSETLSRVETGIEEIEASQTQIIARLDEVARSIDQVMQDTIAGIHIAEIQAAWDDQFVPIMSGQREFSEDRLRAFAYEIAFDKQIQDDVSLLHSVLVNAQVAHKPPLITHYAESVFRSLGEPQEGELLDGYLLVDGFMTDLVLQQRKGEAMYAWAAAFFEQLCEVKAECGPRDALPFTTAEWKELNLGHVRAQTDLFTRVIDQAVLDSSEPTARTADFLHADASQVFFHADFFRAVVLDEGYGLWGRVIDAGDSFQGPLVVGGVEQDVPYVMEFSSTTGPVDWWRKSEGSDVYSEIAFSETWKVHHTRSDMTDVGEVGIETPMPYHTKVQLLPYDHETGTLLDGVDEGSVAFGSFYVIARAGGAYAMNEKAWATPGHTGRDVNASSDPDEPWLVVRRSGTVDWMFGRLIQRETGRTSSSLRRLAPVIYSGSEPLKLHLSTDGGALGLNYCEYTACIEDPAFPTDAQAFAWTSYSHSYLDAGGTSLDARSGVVFGEPSERNTNGAVFEVDFSTDREGMETDGSELGPMEAAVVLPAGEPVYPYLFSELGWSVHSSGMDATRFYLLAGLKPVGMYLALN